MGRPNCLMECGTHCNVQHELRSFKGIMCTNHFKACFGIRPHIQTFIGSDTDTTVGPYFIVNENVTFQQNTVVLPTREYIDKYILMKDTANIDDSIYKPNPILSSYIKHLINNASVDSQTKEYQLEILRNLLIESHEKVELAYKADQVKEGLKNSVQDALSAVFTKIKNETYYKYAQNHVHVASNQVPAREDLGPFEYFFLFNVMPDASTIFQDEVNAMPKTLDFNLIYIKDVGYVTKTQICNPMELVVSASYHTNPFYFTLKVSAEQKSHGHVKFNKYTIPDNQRLNNLISNPRTCWK